MKKNRADKDEGLFIDPLLTRPDRVAIVALGASAKSFIMEQMSNGGMNSPFDEVWTVNRGLRGFVHDKVFCMDDLKWLEKRNKSYANFLKNHDRPIITSTPYPDYPMSIPYPLHEVMETIEDDIFTQNTIAYMVAYAIHTGVKELTVYGGDFVYPNGNFSEKGGQAVAYLLGMFKSLGMCHRLPGDTTLLYANTVKPQPDGTIRRTLYGYHRKEEVAEDVEKEKQRKRRQKESK